MSNTSEADQIMESPAESTSISSGGKNESFEEEKKSETTSEGVKKLEEEFNKASVAEPKPNATSENIIGPLPPTEQDYDPEELKKAEEFKNQGNEFFKGKFSS